MKLTTFWLPMTFVHAGLELHVLEIRYDLEPLEEPRDSGLRVGVALDRQRPSASPGAHCSSARGRRDRSRDAVVDYERHRPDSHSCSQTSSGMTSAMRRRMRSHATRLPIAAARASERSSRWLSTAERNALRLRRHAGAPGSRRARPGRSQGPGAAGRRSGSRAGSLRRARAGRLRRRSPATRATAFRRSRFCSTCWRGSRLTARISPRFPVRLRRRASRPGHRC